MNRRKDLANAIWKACDIMRRDDGTTGILEYMEQLSWLIFLKIFEDIEQRIEHETTIRGKNYEPIIDPKYHWSSWTRKEWKSTENQKDFIDNKLFVYLKSISGTPEKEKIALIFNEITGNRIKSSFNLKDVIALINSIDFNDAEDTHVVSQVYEDLLLRMGKEGGIAGEFYTPRPIVKLMVKIVDPKVGETIFDPFCGSCGFLVESYKHLMEKNSISQETVNIIQNETLYAQEKKPLPYLLGIMNSILHGIFNPNITRKNTLENDIRIIPDTQQYNIILTNPPFGGKESNRIQQNFPTPNKATELLALQYIMKCLKQGGRCSIVVPEGILFRGDAFKKVKKELIDNFNLHTIISLPPGIFATVSSSGQGPKTNLLFFDRTHSTKEIWYYQHLPSDGKNYSKVNSITDEDLEKCYEKWESKEISENSWKISVEEIIEKNYDLTARNPNLLNEFKYIAPEELITSIIEKETRILQVLKEIQSLLGEKSEEDNEPHS